MVSFSVFVLLLFLLFGGLVGLRQRLGRHVGTGALPLVFGLLFTFLSGLRLKQERNK